MMKRQILIAMLIAAAMAVGCSKSDSPSIVETATPDGYKPSTTSITFEPEYNWGDDDEAQTKGFATVYGYNFSDFGVLAYYGDKDADISTLTPNFMYDQEVNLNEDEDTWSYSPLRYWPENDTDCIQFFAYHPYGSDDIVLSGSDVTGYPTFTVTPAEKPYYQDDFIFDYTEKMSKTATGVEFSFEHKLAQARIYAAQSASDDAEIYILGMTVSGYAASGVLKYDSTSSDYKWELPSSDVAKATYSFNSKELSNEEDVMLPYLSSLSTDIDDYTQLGWGKGQSYMMLIPDDNIGELNFSVLFSYKNSDGKVQAYQEFILDEGSALVEGEIKVYLLTIDPTGVGFGTIAVTSESWVETPIYKDNTDTDEKWEIE